MGHNRLQYPPDTQKWLPVVEAVADGADVAAVAGATLAAVEKGLEQAKGDAGLAHAVWLLAHVALAARNDDFQAALATKGVDVPAGATVVDIVAGLSDAMDRQLRATRGRTDIGEMAQLAAAESIAELVGRESTDLFGSREAVQEAFRSYSTKDGFGNLAHAFFSRFVERYLGYHLSRELSRHVGESQRFADPEAHSAFLDRLRSHSQQVALIVKQFSAGWHSKSKLGTVPNMPPIVETAYMYDNASSRTGAFDARPGSAQPLSHRYDHDGLHRLTEAIRGVWNGSLTTPAVTQLRNSQAWGLDPLGNWLEVATDLDGAGSFDADEVETRDFRDPVTSTNRVNELHQRILAVDAGGDELALTYDFAGNLIRQELTNDGTDATALQFTYDAWNRLVQVEFEDEEEDLHPRGEYEYNGLNQRTVARADSNVTNSTHALDEKRMMYYSPEWRLLEERVDANYQSSPGINSHVQYVWGERYIDDIVATRHDPDPAEEDGYEVVHFHLTDVQFSTVAMLSSTAVVLERVTYSAYGMARHHPFSDVDGDGDADTTDVGLVNAAIGKVIGDVGYRSEFDLNRDGSITLADRGLMSAASALPEGVLSSAAVGNRIGYCGYVFAPETQMYLARIRWLSTVLGRWGQRDPIEYIDGQNLYSYVKISPISYTDPFGLQASWSYLNIWQRHHPIPLRLGGCPKQPLFHLPRDQHQLITNWWDKHFPKEGAGLAKWNRCSPARQRWIIRATMMRFAKVPEDVLGSCMDDIFKGLRTVPQPRGYGKVVWRYGTGRILGVAFGAAGVIDMFASDCYAPTLALPPQDWRELVGDSRKCMCECTTELIQKIEPCWWAIFEQEEYSTIPCANEPWIGLDDMTALECRDLEGIIEAREVGSATGFTIYEMEVVTCRWAGIRYGLPGAPLPSW